MKLNADKCHKLISVYKNEHQLIQMFKDMVLGENEVKLLVTAVDNERKFDNHISNASVNTNKKLSVLGLKIL